MARSTNDCWIGAACEYCGLEWERGATGKRLRFDPTDDAIVCARGFGCARRRPEHERFVLVNGRKRKQYLLDGYWYREQQLADLTEVSRQCVHWRLAAGWTVADALLPSYDRGSTSRTTEYKRRVSVALRRAGGTPSKVTLSDTRGRPPKYAESGVSLARRFGKATAVVYRRLHAHGYEEVLRWLLAETRGQNDSTEVAA
jgi:hypothetical protein